jgi:hypothetical protein
VLLSRLVLAENGDLIVRRAILKQADTPSASSLEPRPTYKQQTKRAEKVCACSDLHSGVTGGGFACNYFTNWELSFVYARLFLFTINSFTLFTVFIAVLYS